MRKATVLTALAVLAVSLPGAARAQTTKAVLYDSGPARALGMGNAFTAVADDAEAVLWNPAGLTRMTGREVTYADGARTFPKGMRFVSYAQPGQDGPAGALSYLRVTNAPFGIKEQSLGYTFAHEMGSALAIGLNVKYSRYERGTSGKETFNVDAGALYRVAPNVTLGLGILNAMSPDIASGDGLPTAKAARLINTGVSFRLHPYVLPGQLGAGPRSYSTTLAVEVFDLTDELNRQLRFGVEQRLSERYTARVGLLSDVPTVGLGARMNGYVLNAGVLIGRSGRRSTESMFSVTSAF
jgi:hypothetical protein